MTASNDGSTSTVTWESTRAEVRAVAPRLAELMEEVFPRRLTRGEEPPRRFFG